MTSCPYCKASLEPATAGLIACSACMNPCVIEGFGTDLHAHFIKGVNDVRVIAGEGTIGGEILKALPKALEELPILPEVSQRILQLLRDPEMTIQALASLISQDQVIAIRVLRLANSAMYGGLQEIKDLNAACARLGTRTIANAVQAIANGNLYITGNPVLRENMSLLWRHAVATAHCAAELAVATAEPRGDILFVAGLVHDIGRVVLLDIIANQYRGVLADLRNSPELLGEVFAGYSPLIGLHVALKWKLPPEFRATTFFLRTPEAATDESTKVLINIVAVAEAIAETSGFGLGMELPSLLSLPSARALGMTDMKLAMVRADLEDKLAPLLDVTAA